MLNRPITPLDQNGRTAESTPSSEQLRQHKQTSHIISLGGLDCWQYWGEDFPEDAKVHFVDFKDLTTKNILELKPEIVVSPLLLGNLDILDIAEKLNGTPFIGRLCVVTSNLPDPTLVKREIQFMYPNMDLELITNRHDLKCC